MGWAIKADEQHSVLRELSEIQYSLGELSRRQFDWTNIIRDLHFQPDDPAFHSRLEGFAENAEELAGALRRLLKMVKP